jgi:hypothetical protein
VSGLFNWIAPIENQNISGRSFNLESGEIQSTEVIYKYQLKPDNIKEEKEN